MKLSEVKSWFFSVLAAFCLPCMSFAEDWNSKTRTVSLDLDHIHDLGLLPVGMMDDDALLNAVEAAHQGIDLDDHYNLNLIWLLGNHVDAKSWRGHKETNLLALWWHQFFGSDTWYYEGERLSSSNKEGNQWSDIDNYRLKLRQDEVSLQLVLSF